MKIRAATQSDKSAIAAVQAKSWQTTYREMLPDAYLDNEVVGELDKHWSNVDLLPEDVVLVAETDRVIGFIAIWCRPDAFIDNLHIFPDHQSKGIGGKLMIAAADALRRLGHSTAYLWVMADNQRAIGFYEGLGGVRTKVETKDIFGHMVANVKIEWPDISMIGDPAGSATRPRST